MLSKVIRLIPKTCTFIYLLCAVSKLLPFSQQTLFGVVMVQRGHTYGLAVTAWGPQPGCGMSDLTMLVGHRVPREVSRLLPWGMAICFKIEPCL